MSLRSGALTIALVVSAITSLVFLTGAPTQDVDDMTAAVTGPRAKPRSAPARPDATFPVPTPPEGIEAVNVTASVSAPEARFVVPQTPAMANFRVVEEPEPGATLPRPPGPPEEPGTAASGISQGGPGQEPEPQADHRDAPLLNRSFDSTDFDTNATHTGFLFIPPDPHGAAGPNHLVNVVNVTIRTHNKNGTLGLDDSLANFFSSLSPANATFDPKVLYDQYANRFVVVTLELVDDGVCASDNDCSSRILMAVSDDSNPAGTWYFASIVSELTINTLDRWADYPGFGVDEEAVYITTNMFAYFNAGQGFGGVRLWVIDKGLSGGFYDGGTADVAVYDPYAGGGFTTTTQPAHMYGSGPSGVGTFLVSYSGLTDGTNEAVQVVRMDDPLGSPTFTQQFVNVGDIENANVAPLPDAPQDGTATLIEVNDRRALDADWRNNSLYLTATTLPNSGPDSGETTAAWWELDTSNLANLTVADQGQIGGEEIAPGAFTFFPAIAVNEAEHVGIGYSVSADSIFASSAYTSRSRQDPPGEVRVSRLLRAGTDHYLRTFGGPRNRWGDYSGMAVDPATNCFWVYNEHAIDRGTPTAMPSEDGRWGTAWGHFCSGDFGIFNAGIESPDIPPIRTLLSLDGLDALWAELVMSLPDSERQEPASF